MRYDFHQPRTRRSSRPTAGYLPVGGKGLLGNTWPMSALGETAQGPGLDDQGRRPVAGHRTATQQRDGVDPRSGRGVPDHVERADPQLYPMFVLILHRGLRRGEACGIREIDIDLDAATATIAQ